MMVNYIDPSAMILGLWNASDPTTLWTAAEAPTGKRAIAHDAPRFPIGRADRRNLDPAEPGLDAACAAFRLPR